ncbi:RNA-directed DNA polymerase from mobile element jockey-like protein [Willisornis vidua]|uniref:RNA-directed DNA polymerase from mobile element jockey-like protein n=1 Tax=Willisornis vidua TaxID=1566151 RepID=A0ABQ9CRQ0_9PASS|nr:RNA-directed DNA polymerase from mobile element jockey-like protein [Willisornis vidua]
MWQQLILRAISIYMDDTKGIRSSQHGFTKSKSCFTNVIAFCDETTTWRTVDIVYFEFSKALDSISHTISIGKLRNCGMDEWTVMWIENWLTGTSQRVIISGKGSSLRPVTRGVP